MQQGRAAGRNDTRGCRVVRVGGRRSHAPPHPRRRGPHASAMLAAAAARARTCARVVAAIDALLGLPVDWLRLGGACSATAGWRAAVLACCAAAAASAGVRWARCASTCVERWSAPPRTRRRATSVASDTRSSANHRGEARTWAPSGPRVLPEMQKTACEWRCWGPRRVLWPESGTRGGG